MHYKEKLLTEGKSFRTSESRVPGTREVVKVDTYQQLFRPGTHAYEQAVKFDNNWVYLPIPCSKGGYIGETSKHFMHLETE